MKHLRLFTLLLVFIFALGACNNGQPPESSEISDNASDASEISPYKNINTKEIISPYSELQNNAKNPWDLIIHNGYLYVGGGDYDINISPKTAFRYNLSAENWETCGSIPDEQIRNFVIIDDELYIPGTDPTGDWSYGNFYKLEDDSFVTYRTIPNAVHCFDLAKFDDKIFAAIAVKDGSFPVVLSEDNGKTFQRIPVITDDHNYQKNERVYSLFVLNDSLYAILGNNVYQYTDGVFRFVCSWQNKFVNGYNFYSPIAARVTFKNRVFFTSGYLYSFENVNDLEYIPFENVVVSDIIVNDDILYILCFSMNKNGSYTNTIKRSDDGCNFETVYEFIYDCSALSFAINDNDVYIGIGETIAQNDKKGLIIKAEDII